MDELRFYIWGWAFAFVGNSFFMEMGRAVALAFLGAVFAGIGGWVYKNKIKPFLDKNLNNRNE